MSSRGGGWPTVDHEEIRWDGDPTRIPRSRRTNYTPTYLASVVAPIAGVAGIPLDTETTAIADEATREITRFDTELGGHIAPFASILLRSESAASSQIEHLTASAKAIGLAELDEASRHNATLIVSNVRAMDAAIRLADRLDEDAIIAMHAELLEASAPRIVGRWRDAQVWIGGTGYGPHEASFVAPHHERVPAAMADLVEFMRRDDLPVLTQAAVAHAQFETIHPFPDGNGRTGRALVHSLLRSKEVSRSVTVPVSAGLLTDTQAYFDSLTAYREGDPGPIVAQMSTAAFSSIQNGRLLVDDIRAARQRWQDQIQARRHASVWRIADHLLAQPVVTSTLLQLVLGVSAPSVNGALERLAEAGVVTNMAGRSRNRVWVAEEIIQALDAFAERAGRRRH